MNQLKDELDAVKYEVDASEPTLSDSRHQGLFEKLRLSRLAKVAATAGALSLAFSASTVGAETSSSSFQAFGGQQLAGYNSNKIWVTDQQAAEQEAELIAASGADAVRIQEPYTVGGAEINNDAERLCNAAIVANKNHLRLIIAMVGHYSDGRLGFMPSSESQKNRFTTAVGSMMWTLAGSEHGCVPDQKDITIGLFDEPDNPTFNSNQYVDGQWVAPQREVSLLSYAYPRLKAEALKPGLGVNLTIIGGELSSPSSEHDNTSFIKKMGQIIQQRKLTGPIMDVFALHQYANSYDTSPEAPNNSFNPNVVDAVRTTFGADMPVIYDELGAYSETPKGKEHQYIVRLPAAVKPFTGTGQGDFYSRFISKAICHNVQGVMIFHFSDDPGDTLRTGVAFPDNSPKPSQEIVRQSIDNPLGNTVCP